jgi:AP-1 complex subunit gamma-1
MINMLLMPQPVCSLPALFLRIMIFTDFEPLAAESGHGAPTKQATATSLLDLEGLSLGASPPITSTAAPSNPLALMADIFSPTSTAGAVPPQPAVNPLALLMSSPTPAPVNLTSVSPMTAAKMPSPSAGNDWNRAYPAFQQGDVSITLTPSRVSDGGATPLVHVDANFLNSGGINVEGVQLLVAVPKTHKIMMNPISNGTLSAMGGSATQAFRILNPENKSIKLRLKVLYKKGDVSVDEVVNFQFPDSIV